MRGGVDRGFCLIYWKLSYRRKFWRTLWTILIGLLLVIGVVAFSSKRFGTLDYLFVAAIAVIGVLQAFYSYYRWQSETGPNDRA